MIEPSSNNQDQIGKNEKLIDIWGRRTPKFEKRFEESVLRVLSDYGIGASEHTTAKGKILGAGYEPYILAFFIGLYNNKRIPLSSETKSLGQPLQFWGNLDSRKNRHAYPRLRNYIFIALVAKSDIDWIALDKGEIKVNTAVATLIETMEEYANYGFTFMEEKLKEDKGYFFSNRSFLDIFLRLTTIKEPKESAPEDLPEEL